jgi:hypothetical protein
LYITNLVINTPYLINNFKDCIEYIYSEFNFEANLYLIKENINILINEYSVNFNGDVLYEIITICIKYNFEIKDETYLQLKDSILNNNDSISLTLLFLYSKEFNLNLDVFYEKLELIDEKENWLYVYELYKNNKNKFKLYKNELEYEQFYNYLYKNNITFISEYLNKNLYNWEDYILNEENPF